MSTREAAEIVRSIGTFTPGNKGELKIKLFDFFVETLDIADITQFENMSGFETAEEGLPIAA